MLVRLIFLCFLWRTTNGHKFTSGEVDKEATTPLDLTPQNLINHYNEIFPRTHNRNAASHLWTTYVLKHVWGNATADEIYGLFAAFCPISGSPTSTGPRSRWYNLKVKKATNTEKIVIGRANFCCSPCPCDLEEFVRYDTKQIKTKSGMQSFPVLVIGDPCKFPDKKIPEEASELYCEKGHLHGITLSDHGHVIIGMLQPHNKPAANDAADDRHQNFCEFRRNRPPPNRYAGGMGAIFADMAAINPIN